MNDTKQLPSYVTGDFFEGDEPDVMALGSYDFIARDLNDIKRSYFRLGFHLNEFDRCKYYQQFGYTCLSDFALCNWGLEPSFVSRCIAVFFLLQSTPVLYPLCSRKKNTNLIVILSLWK